MYFQQYLRSFIQYFFKNKKEYNSALATVNRYDALFSLGFWDIWSLDWTRGFYDQVVKSSILPSLVWPSR